MEYIYYSFFIMNFILIVLFSICLFHIKTIIKNIKSLEIDYRLLLVKCHEIIRTQDMGPSPKTSGITTDRQCKDRDGTWIKKKKKK